MFLKEMRWDEMVGSLIIAGGDTNKGWCRQAPEQYAEN